MPSRRPIRLELDVSIPVTHRAQTPTTSNCDPHMSLVASTPTRLYGLVVADGVWVWYEVSHVFGLAGKCGGWDEIFGEDFVFL